MLPTESRFAPVSPAPPSAALWLGAASLIVGVGAWLHLSGLSHAWMPLIHQHAWFNAAYWSFWTTMGFGWACAIAVSISDRRGDSGIIQALIVVLLMSAVVSPGLKALFDEPRPGMLIPGHLAMIGGPVLGHYSMPSGHSMAGFSMAGLWVLAMRGRAWASVSLMAACWTVAALIAISRVAVGAHWPGDVLVGSGLGVWMAWTAWSVQSRHMQTPRWQSPAWPITIEVVAAIVAFTANEGYPLANWVQWVMGALALASAAERFWRWRQSQPTTQGSAA